MPVRYLFAFVLSVCFLASNPWGFYAHKEINYLACFTLPPEMFGFYKTNISTIQELAVRADQRRYAIDAEAPRQGEQRGSRRAHEALRHCREKG